MHLSLDELSPHIIFEENHFDGPISGLCRISGQLHYFGVAHWDEDELYPLEYRTTPLYGFRKFKALADKRWFEFCIGTYWSYDRKSRDYHPKRPRWLRQLLWMVFYRRRNPLMAPTRARDSTRLNRKQQD